MTAMFIMPLKTNWEMLNPPFVILCDSVESLILCKSKDEPSRGLMCLGARATLNLVSLCLQDIQIHQKQRLWPQHWADLNWYTVRTKSSMWQFFLLTHSRCAY